MPPAPLGARLCRMPAPCLTGRNGVFCRAPGRRRALRLPHISPKNGLFPLRQAAAQSMCAARRRPSLPAQTSHPHATARRLPPRFPIGEYTGVHSSPTFSRRPFPAPFHFRAFRAALPPRFAPAPSALHAPVFRPPATAPKSPPPRLVPCLHAPRRAFPFSSRSFLHAPGKAGRITSLRLRVRVPSRPQATVFRRLHLTSPSKNHCFFTPLRPFLSTIEF